MEGARLGSALRHSPPPSRCVSAARHLPRFTGEVAANKKAPVSRGLFISEAGKALSRAFRRRCSRAGSSPCRADADDRSCGSDPRTFPSTG
ncbi:hypothetical protein DDF62_23605 [Caulobacter radicis]|nr:hypothetical protein DDF62_23605 [Caulobacter radicis]